MAAVTSVCAISKKNPIRDQNVVSSKFFHKKYSTSCIWEKTAKNTNKIGSIFPL